MTDGRGTNPAYWTQRLRRIRDLVYPSGTIATLPDSVTANFDLSGTGGTKPAEAASVTRMTITSPGGRIGDSLNADLLIPSATAVGKCLVFFTGHNQAASGWSGFYCHGDGTSIISRMLARGWHVLAADMPSYGQQGTPFHITLGGTSHEIPYSHPYSAGIGDGGPSISRIFVDHVFRAMAQVTSDLSISSFSLAGHSGGAAEAILAAVLDDRFRVVHILQEGAPFFAIGDESSECAEAARSTPAIGSAGPTLRDWWSMAACSVGRKLVFHIPPQDEWAPGQEEAWVSFVSRLNEWIPAAYPGASVEFVLKTDPSPTPDPITPTPYHDPSPLQAAWIEAHLVANG